MHALSCYVHVTADLYYAVEFISVIKALLLYRGWESVSNCNIKHAQYWRPFTTSTSATIQLHTCPCISNNHLYMSCIMHTILIRCICLTQWHRVDACITQCRNILISDTLLMHNIIHLRCIYLTVVSSTIYTLPMHIIHLRCIYISHTMSQ